MSSKCPPQTVKRSSKKPYIKPILVAYGRVSDLTLANGTAPRYEENCGNAINTGSTRRCSERHTKENITRLGSHWKGFGLYLFDYRAPYRDQWGHDRQFGVMVDEVEPVVPQAISVHPDGYKVVDYSLLGISRPLH